MMKLLALFAPIFLLAVSAAAGSSASSWPMFRGNPALTGIASTALPDKLSLLWKFKTGAPVKSSAIIADGKVFFGSGDQSVYAVDLQSGKKIWSFKTEDGVDAPGLFHEGHLFIGSNDGFLYALNAKSGALLWKYKTDGKILSAPNLIPARSGAESKVPSRILFGSYDYKLHCVDARDGKSNWVYETANYINGSPAVSDGKTVFGGCDGLLHVISIEDGRQIKELDAGAYVAASVALADNRAYFGHYENEFLCLDLNSPGLTNGPTESSSVDGTNSPVIWRYKNREFAYMSSAAVTADRVLVGGRDKLLHCLNRSNGERVWTFATQGKVDSSPVVAGDKVVVGSADGRLYVVSLKTGKEVWSYEVGESIESSPAVADGKVVIGSEDGFVYCFGGKK